MFRGSLLCLLKPTAQEEYEEEEPVLPDAPKSFLDLPAPKSSNSSKSEIEVLKLMRQEKRKLQKDKKDKKSRKKQKVTDGDVSRGVSAPTDGNSDGKAESGLSGLLPPPSAPKKSALPSAAEALGLTLAPIDAGADPLGPQQPAKGKSKKIAVVPGGIGELDLYAQYAAQFGIAPDPEDNETATAAEYGDDSSAASGGLGLPAGIRPGQSSSSSSSSGAGSSSGPSIDGAFSAEGRSTNAEAPAPAAKPQRLDLWRAPKDEPPKSNKCVPCISCCCMPTSLVDQATAESACWFRNSPTSGECASVLMPSV